jgi:thiamine pyrophosphate-dependent acetolactate synthase large subunit-like protein
LVFSYNPKPTLNIDKIQEAAKLINAAKAIYTIWSGV